DVVAPQDGLFFRLVRNGSFSLKQRLSIHLSSLQIVFTFDYYSKPHLLHSSDSGPFIDRRGRHLHDTPVPVPAALNDGIKI
ncbi:MAG: hypothetical protein KKF01_10905, partial [Proteobacteria bacterium]|nr:hypothetical protein [Pseudomonadota bacterium]